MRRAAISVLMLAVLLPATAFARVAYLCARDRQVRSSCCCPPRAKQPAPAPQPTLTAARCCEVSAVEPVTPLVVDVQKDDGSIAPPMVAITALAPAIVPPRREVTFAPRAHAPPEPERTLFASHCALLL